MNRTIIFNLKTLHSQLEYAVQRNGGKTTITARDLDDIKQAILKLEG